MCVVYSRTVALQRCNAPCPQPPITPTPLFTFSPFHLFNLWLKGQFHTACRSTPPPREAAAGFWASRPTDSTVHSAVSSSGGRCCNSLRRLAPSHSCNSFSCVFLPLSILPQRYKNSTNYARKFLTFFTPFPTITDNVRQCLPITDSDSPFLRTFAT